MFTYSLSQLFFICDKCKTIKNNAIKLTQIRSNRKIVSRLNSNTIIHLKYMIPRTHKVIKV